MIPFTCEACGARFAPLTGASCAHCRRLLCARHFSWLGAIGLRLRTSEPVCRDCRRRAAPSS